MSQTQQLQLALQGAELMRATTISSRITAGQQVSQVDYNFLQTKYPEMLIATRESQRKVAVQQGYAVASMPETEEAALAQGGPGTAYMSAGEKQKYYDQVKAFYVASEKVESQEKAVLAQRVESVRFYRGLGYPQFGGLYAPVNLEGKQVVSVREESVVGPFLNEATRPKYLVFEFAQPQTKLSSEEKVQTALTQESRFSQLYLAGRPGASQGTRTDLSLQQVVGEQNKIVANLSPEEKGQFKGALQEGYVERARGLVLMFGTAIAAPILGPVGALKAAAFGVGVSQGVKSAWTAYSGGDVSKSWLTPMEVYESAAGGVAFAGAGKVVMSGIGTLGRTGAVVAEKVVPSSTKIAVGAASARVGTSTVIGAGGSYVLSGGKPEAALQGALFGAGFGLAGEAGTKGLSSVKAKATGKLTESYLAREKLNVDILEGKSMQGQTTQVWKPTLTEKFLMRATGARPQSPSSTLVSTFSNAENAKYNLGMLEAESLAFDLGVAPKSAYMGVNRGTIPKVEGVISPKTLPLTFGLGTDLIRFSEVKRQEQPQLLAFKKGPSEDIKPSPYGEVPSYVREAIISGKATMPLSFEKGEQLTKGRSSLVESSNIPRGVKAPFGKSEPMIGDMQVSESIGGFNKNVANAESRLGYNRISSSLQSSREAPLLRTGQTQRGNVWEKASVTMNQMTKGSAWSTSTRISGIPLGLQRARPKEAEESTFLSYPKSGLNQPSTISVKPEQKQTQNISMTPPTISLSISEISEKPTIFISPPKETSTPSFTSELITSPVRTQPKQTSIPSIVSGTINVPKEVQLPFQMPKQSVMQSSKLETPQVNKQPSPFGSGALTPKSFKYPSFYSGKAGGGDSTRSLFGGRGKYFKKKNPVPTAFEFLENFSLVKEAKSVKSRGRSQKVVIKIVMPKAKIKRKRK